MDEIATIEVALGVELEDVSSTAQGQQRTFFAIHAGRPVVVKWGLDPDLPEKLPYVAGQVPELRRRGVPVPEITVMGPLPTGGYAWIAQRLPGEPATVLSTDLLRQLLALLDKHINAPAGRHRSDLNRWVVAVVEDDIAGWQAATTALGPQAARLCERLRGWAGHTGPPPVRTDYVHIDLNLGNVLVEHGRISGLVDVENLGVGDRTVDVARLAFEWFWQNHTDVAGCAPQGLRQLVQYGRACNGEAGWRYAVVYELISRLGWRSEHTTRVDPSTLVAASTEFLGAVH